MTIAFGSDFDLASDLRPDLGVASTELVALAQSIVRRLSAGRRGYFYSPSDGYDLALALGASGSIDTIRQRASAELQKDERVLAALVTDLSQGPDDLSLAVDVTLRGGPSFRLTISVDEAAQVLVASEPIPIRQPYRRRGGV